MHVVYAEAIMAPNGEIVHFGQTLGWANARQIELVENGACKITKGGEPIVSLGERIA